MCRAGRAFKHAIGIHDYVPHHPLRAPVRKSIWHSARGNGRGLAGLHIPTDPTVERLAREHRIIRQMIADTARWAEGHE